MTDSWPSWDEWLATLDDERRLQAVALRDTFERLGAGRPEDWARSEVSEGIAQLARFHFLHGLWQDMVAPLGEEQVLRNLGAAPLLDVGADANQLGVFVQRIVSDRIHALLYRLGYGSDQELDEPLPGWRLMETDADRELTGRPVDFLHESFGPDM